MTFTLPKGQETRLIELSLAPDSSFSTTGEFKINISGATESQITSQSLPSTLTIPFHRLSESNKVFKSGSKIEVFGKSDGSTTISVTGVIFGEGV